MGKLRELVMKTEIKTSLRANECRFNGAHKIPKGDLRFVVTPPAAVAREYSYCVDCAIAMLENAEAKIAAQLATLRDGEQPPPATDGGGPG
ncbi:MAG: hypothetical protein AB7I38_11645 [Dehalococcoidia bacterium]